MIRYLHNLSLYCALAIVIVASYSCNPPPYFESVKKVFPAVVRILAGDQMGSGVIVSAGGLVLTSQHVVKDNKTATVLLNSGAQFQGNVVSADSNRDLAIIRIQADDITLPQAALGESGESDELQTGSPLLVLGYPAGNKINQISLTTGILCAFRTIESVKFLQSEAKIAPGSSGGPMLSSNGEVIGIINSKYVDMEGSCATFATAASEAAAMLNDLARPPRPPPQATSIIIRNARSENVTSNSASLLWETSLPCYGGVEFRQPAMSKFYPSADNRTVTLHSVQISGLAPRESYRYRIFARDREGREAASAEMTLTTAKTACEKVGCRAPDFDLPAVGGGYVSLDSLKGKKAILVFITTGCSSCAEIMRCIHKIYDNWPRQQMEVVAIVSGEKEADVQRWIKLYGIKCPVVLDPDRKVINYYKPEKMPAVYFINGDGEIKAKRYSPISGCGNEIDSILRLY